MAQMMADEQREVAEIGPGHIGAIAGLKVTSTGETLCLRGDPRAIVLDGVTLPRPVFSAALEVRGCCFAVLLAGRSDERRLLLHLRWRAHLSRASWTRLSQCSSVRIRAWR